MNFLSVLKLRLRDRKSLGQDLAITGGSMLLSKFMLGVAPLVIAFFGLYQIVFKKKYFKGILFIVGSVSLWILLNWRPFHNLLWLIALIGILIFCGGIFLLVMNKKNS